MSAMTLVSEGEAKTKKSSKKKQRPLDALHSVQRGRRSRPEQPQPSALVPGDRSLRGHHEGRLGSPRVQQKRAPRPHPPETSLTAEPRSRQVCGR
uniref:Uncharacterized protein n=2 Tax=Rangifer tarandus platyrhynchus TaxID=3082113 RepID=A0ACB0F4G6_RANTA|nr:unnamed protein product [Rangifer tarandus platyrhynchus]